MSNSPPPPPPPPSDHWPAGYGKGANDPKYGNGLRSSFHVTYLLSAPVLHASLSTNRGLRLGGSAGFLSDAPLLQRRHQKSWRKMRFWTGKAVAQRKPKT